MDDGRVSDAQRGPLSESYRGNHDSRLGIDTDSWVDCIGGVPALTRRRKSWLTLLSGVYGTMASLTNAWYSESFQTFCQGA